MGPGFESQRDHKIKLNQKIGLFLCPLGSNEARDGFELYRCGMSMGNVRRRKSQRDHKIKLNRKIGLFLYPLGSNEAWNGFEL